MPARITETMLAAATTAEMDLSEQAPLYARCVPHLVNLDRHQGCAFSGTPTRPAEKSIRWKCRLDLPLQQTRESLGNMQHIHDYPRVDRNGACTDDRDRRSDDDFGTEYLVLGIEPYAEEQAKN
jgi:hypothetical protein